MIYLGKTPIFSMGTSRVSDGSFGVHDALYVKNACLVARYAKQSGNTRNAYMDRVYDWLNYSNVAFGGTPPAGGFEVETTIVPLENDDKWQCVWGTRNGSSGYVTRANLVIGADGRVGMGLSNDPSENIYYGEPVFGRAVHIRFLCIPTTSQDYEHAYSGRLIVQDATGGTTLSDNTLVWGDNFGTGNDAMFSAITTFYTFHSAWFSRNRYQTPSQNASTGNDFHGYFLGGAVYINPTGADTSVATRFPVQALTPVKGGTKFGPSKIFNNINKSTITADGVFCETVDITDLPNVQTGEKPLRKYAVLMTNCANYTEAQLIYQD